MKKTLTTADVRNIGGQLFSNWDAVKDDIKLPGKGLYHLLALKKTLESHLNTIEETLAALARQYGGVPQENGAILIPTEQRQEANVAFMEFGNETIEIEYHEISLKDSDHLPVSVFEALFDFIVFSEE